MANLIPISLISSYRTNFPSLPNGGWINAKRMVDLYTVNYLNSSNVSTIGALINYAINRKGWRDNYAELIVSQTVAQILASIGVMSTGKKIALPVTKKGTNYLTATIYVNVDDIILISQSSADLALAAPGQCEVLIQHGVWDAETYVVSLTPAAILALAEGAGTSGLVTLAQTIGFPGSGVDNFNFTSATNKTAQNIQIATIPAFAVVYNITIFNTVAFAGGSVSALNVTLGNASADNGILTSTDLHALNAFAAGTLTEVALSASAVNIWLGATPVTANWNQLTAGQLKVVINYINQANS